MQETQLACPHCGSTLNFGTQIAPGTQVECLICMNSFAAQPMPNNSQPARVEVPNAPTAQPAPVAVAAKSANPQAAKVEAQPPPTAVAAKPLPKAPPPLVKPAKASKPTGPRLRRPEEQDGHGVATMTLVAVALGLLLVLGGGVSIVVWKIASSRDPVDTPFALDPSADPQNEEQPGLPGNDKKPQTKKANNPTEEIDDDTKKLIAAEKKGLVRKKTADSGPEVDWTLPINVKVDQQTTYAGLSQKRINDSIDKGILYLRKTQQPTGGWIDMHAVGHASLSGLTLLECGAPANDVAVQRAAMFIRPRLATLDFTYELSLAILFLDRLGDPRDRPLIQGMALRLLAGQNDCGGWHYNCMLLNPQEMYQLYVFLHSNRQPGLFNPLLGTSDRSPLVSTSIPRAGKGNSDTFSQFGSLLAKGAEAAAPDPAKPAAQPKKTVPLRPDWLTANLQNLAVVRNQGKGKGKIRLSNGSGDNSNTQFALLALWAARRHDIPTEHAIMAAYQRFLTSQNKDGGWGYAITHNQNSTNSMTCVGLLGLAMGHGTAPDIVKFDPKNPKDAVVRPALEDPNIQRALKLMASHIGTPVMEGEPQFPNMPSLYWLWSIERVAMLYDLKTINGKEWYPWGAQILVHRQDPSGCWPQSLYAGSNANVNTCFALLFLKRSNLVQDLTNNLRLYTGIRDPEK